MRLYTHAHTHTHTHTHTHIHTHTHTHMHTHAHTQTHMHTCTHTLSTHIQDQHLSSLSMAAWSSEKVTDGSRVRLAVFPSDEVTRILLCAGFPEVGLGGEGGVVEEVGGGGETPRTCVCGCVCGCVWVCVGVCVGRGGGGGDSNGKSTLAL